MRITWLASYPKSGNTWARFLLYSYFYDRPAQSTADVAQFIPDIHEVLARGQDLPSDGRPELIVKTHFRSSAPEMRRYLPATARVIYIVRNPRDVLLSNLRYLGATTPEQRRQLADQFVTSGGLDHWATTFNMGTWGENVDSWYGDLLRSDARIPSLHLRYEDLRESPGQEFTRMVEFLGWPVDPARINRAVGHASLERMRELEDREAAGSSTRPAGNVFGGAGPFVGEGRRNQPLSSLGADIERRYQALLRGSSPFARYARMFMYTDEDQT
jgi:aryl sulfotransferase